MLLNRKARINMTTGFDARLIAREETRGGGGICTFRRRAINDRKCPGPDTFERRFLPAAGVSRPTTFVLKLEASLDWRTGFDFQRKYGGLILCLIVSSKMKTFQRRYGRENIEPRERLTRFRIHKTISHIFLMQFPRLTAHMTNKTALSNGVGRRDQCSRFRSCLTNSLPSSFQLFKRWLLNILYVYQLTFLFFIITLWIPFPKESLFSRKAISIHANSASELTEV